MCMYWCGLEASVHGVSESEGTCAHRDITVFGEWILRTVYCETCSLKNVKVAENCDYRNGFCGPVNFPYELVWIYLTANSTLHREIIEY